MKNGIIISSANVLTKHALMVLHLKGYHAWRQNNAGVYDPVKKVFRAGSVTKGISDIIGFHKKTGQFIACEIKSGNDKLSAYQSEFLETVKVAGAKAFVIKNSTDIEDMIKNI